MDMTFSSLSERHVAILFNWWTVQTEFEFWVSWIAVVVFTIGFHALRYIIQTLDDSLCVISEKRNGNEDNVELNSMLGQQHHQQAHQRYGYRSRNNSRVTGSGTGNSSSGKLDEMNHNSISHEIDLEKNVLVSKTGTSYYSSYSKPNGGYDRTVGSNGTTSSGVQMQDCRRVLLLRILHACLSAASYTLALLLMLISMTYNSTLFLALVIGYGLGDYLFFYLSIQRRMNSSNNSSNINGASIYNTSSSRVNHHYVGDCH
mmetsp:Transcript_25983/g.43289  ORF Transcript_25983/g.43289 Transcript_25983/m.43289 type:complete len:259 (-) Transcript_25983:207-983(-)|eukprot:CAMPEP_0174969468 /NCGR_PEP_ID=MMETSP0004_2-20121128/8777_1 /TAXON_ID=420556 /ORGANISM="Ochromonas sp., Strain CCMP1393" /LENGTH=258 /DNA_ID=CAMNT_0016218957 /DNA_START=81 /DNA_END=857 /DNA_ORIENTATION=-